MSWFCRMPSILARSLMRDVAPATAASAMPRCGTTGRFALSGAVTTRASVAATAPRMIGGIDALIALQGVEDPVERRKHAAKRGRLALDALDALKIGLLGATLT